MSLADLVAAGDEVPGTTAPTGRVAGAWVEFYEAIPGAGFRFWARPAGDAYDVLDVVDPEDGSDPTESYLDAALAADRDALGL
jgi:hypothetical protein